MPPFVQTALVADADAVVVPPSGMGSDMVDGTATMHLAVAGDVEMVADVGKTTLQVTTRRADMGKSTSQRVPLQWTTRRRISR